MNNIEFFRGNKFKKFLFDIYKKISGCELFIDNIGKNVRFPHGLKGIVLHPATIVEDDVTIFHQVTCGRGDMHNIMRGAPKSEFQGIVLKKGSVICVGAKVICNRGTLVVGENTIIAANAVLTQSTGANEIWAGIPARKIGEHKYNL